MGVLDPSRGLPEREALGADAESTQDDSFVSILNPDRVSAPGETGEQPDFFADLNLDQVCAAMFAKRDEYKLTPFFYEPLHECSIVRYRQAVLQDLERDEIVAVIRSFASQMADVRRHLDNVRKLRSGLQKQSWLLAALDDYCTAVSRLGADLAGVDLLSAGLRKLSAYVSEYVHSRAFKALSKETEAMLAQLATVVYTVRTDGPRVTVDRPSGQPDLTVQVEETFAKFRQGNVKSYLVRFNEYLEMNHVELQVLDRVAALFPQEFEHLQEFCTRNRSAFNATLLRFDREVQFFLSYLEFIAPLRAAGLSFAYPRVDVSSKETSVTQAFDLALAAKLTEAGEPVVCNDVTLGGAERLLVITGPNQGGKTTFARMFGQLHHLAALGLPVPGAEAQLFLPDRIFTHFEREEDLSTLHSKFEDDLYRIHAILREATSSSVLVMNESLTSTTLKDAIAVGTLVLRQIIQMQMLCLCVTFVDELASLSENVVSMMSTVENDDPTVRTFKIVRKPADGLAYAVALADKYRLGYEQLKRRVER